MTDSFYEQLNLLISRFKEAKARTNRFLIFQDIKSLVIEQIDYLNPTPPSPFKNVINVLNIVITDKSITNLTVNDIQEISRLTEYLNELKSNNPEDFLDIDKVQDKLTKFKESLIWPEDQIPKEKLTLFNELKKALITYSENRITKPPSIEEFKRFVSQGGYSLNQASIDYIGQIISELEELNKHSEFSDKNKLKKIIGDLKDSLNQTKSAIDKINQKALTKAKNYDTASTNIHDLESKVNHSESEVSSYQEEIKKLEDLKKRLANHSLKFSPYKKILYQIFNKPFPKPTSPDETRPIAQQIRKLIDNFKEKIFSEIEKDLKKNLPLDIKDIRNLDLIRKINNVCKLSQEIISLTKELDKAPHLKKLSKTLKTIAQLFDGALENYSELKIVSNKLSMCESNAIHLEKKQNPQQLQRLCSDLEDIDKKLQTHNKNLEQARQLNLLVEKNEEIVEKLSEKKTQLLQEKSALENEAKEAKKRAAKNDLKYYELSRKEKQLTEKIEKSIKSLIESDKKLKTLFKSFHQLADFEHTVEGKIYFDDQAYLRKKQYSAYASNETLDVKLPEEHVEHIEDKIKKLEEKITKLDQSLDSSIESSKINNIKAIEKINALLERYHKLISYQKDLKFHCKEAITWNKLAVKTIQKAIGSYFFKEEKIGSIKVSLQNSKVVYFSPSPDLFKIFDLIDKVLDHSKNASVEDKKILQKGAVCLRNILHKGNIDTTLYDEQIEKIFGTNDVDTKEKPSSKNNLSSGGNSKTDGKNNKLNSVVVDDPNLKPNKPGLVQNLKPQARTGGGSVALSTHPIDIFNHAVAEIADDFKHYIAEQWDIEKRAARNFIEGSKKVVKGVGNGVKALPHLGKQTFSSALKVTKQGFVLSVQGTNYALKRGVYFTPQITRASLSKAPTAFIAAPLVFETGNMFVIWEREGERAALVHGGKIAAFMLTFNETLYTLGATSQNVFISSGSRFMLGTLRFVTPLAVGYVVYQVGNSERFLKESLPKWAADHPELMEAWYVPYASETAAWGVETFFVKPFSYVAKPTRNKFVELGLSSGVNPENILPFKEQLKLWQQSALEYKKLLTKKEEYKKRILSNFNDPKMNKVIGDLFEYVWTITLFPQYDHEQHLAYYNDQGDLTSIELSGHDVKTYFNTGSEIYVCPFEVTLPNGKSETYFYAVKNGILEQYDSFNSIAKREYVLNKLQFYHLTRLKEFKTILVDEKTIYRIAILNSKKPSIKDLPSYLKDNLHMYFYAVGISPKIIEDKNYKPNKEALRRGKLQYETRLKYNKQVINHYREIVKAEESDYQKFRSFIQQLGTSWLKNDIYTEIRFDNSSLLPNREGVIETQMNLYGLYVKDKTLKTIYYLKKDRLTNSIPYRKRHKDGSYETIYQQVTETVYHLYNAKGQKVLTGDVTKIKAFQDHHKTIHIVRTPEKGDTELINQSFTIINPYNGITSSPTSYKKMKFLVGDMMRLLVVNKIKGPEGNHLFILTHFATNKAIGLFADVNSLYGLFSEKDIKGKYILVKPYEASDRKDFQTNIIILRSQPGKGIYTRYETTSMEASDIVGDVFRLQTQEDTDTYRLIDPFGRNVFEKDVTLKEIDLYLANYHTKAIIVLGTKDKRYLSKQVEQLGQYLLHVKISREAIKFFHIPGKVVWRVDNDHIDKDPNSYSYYMRDYRNKKDTITSNVKDVQEFIGMAGILSAPKTPQQGLIYKDIYGKSYNNYLRDNHYIPKNWAPVTKSQSVLNDKKYHTNLMKKEH